MAPTSGWNSPSVTGQGRREHGYTTVRLFPLVPPHRRPRLDPKSSGNRIRSNSCHSFQSYHNSVLYVWASGSSNAMSESSSDPHSCAWVLGINEPMRENIHFRVWHPWREQGREWGRTWSLATAELGPESGTQRAHAHLVYPAVPWDTNWEPSVDKLWSMRDH